MNPYDHAEYFETVTIGGLTWPGTAEVAGLAFEMGWDAQEASGSSGASLARKGRKLSRFSVRFRMIVDTTLMVDQFDTWYYDWVPMLRACAEGKSPVGLLIEHPDCQALDVQSVVVESIGGVVLEGVGEGHADVLFLQYAPPKKVSTGGPSKSKGDTKGKDGAADYDPNDPIQQRIDELDELLGGP